jgi:hypothetical protein
MKNNKSCGCLLALIITAIIPWVIVYALILTYPNNKGAIRAFWYGWALVILLVLVACIVDYLKFGLSITSTNSVTTCDRPLDGSYVQVRCDSQKAKNKGAAAL